MDFEDRLMDTSEIPQDLVEGDNPLRPKTFDDYVGQEKVKENLKIFIEAAKKLVWGYKAQSTVYIETDTDPQSLL